MDYLSDPDAGSVVSYAKKNIGEGSNILKEWTTFVG